MKALYESIFDVDMDGDVDINTIAVFGTRFNHRDPSVEVNGKEVTDWEFRENDSVEMHLDFDKIKTIQWIGPLKSLSMYGFDGNSMTSADNTFNGCSYTLEDIDLSEIECKNITSARDCFHGAKYDVSLPKFVGPKLKNARCCFLFARNSHISLPKFTGMELEDAHGVFSENPNLKSIDLPEFVGPKVTDISDLFVYCSGLESIELPKFTGESVKTMSRAFYNCTSLKRISLPEFTGEKVTDANILFMSCRNLVEINIPKFVGKMTINNDMFKGCSKLKRVTCTQTFYDQIASSLTGRIPAIAPGRFKEIKWNIV